RLHRKSSHTSIFWIHASGPTRFLSSYKNIATELRLPGFDDPKKSPLDLVFRWLLSESSGQWLLILDNADDVSFVRPDHSKDHAAQHEFTMAQYLPQRDGGAILITSRDKHSAFALAGKSNCILRVEPMSPSEAKTLIDKKIPPELGTSNERDSLASKLEYIPLAITQAAAYITRRERMTIPKYMHYLEIDEEEASLLKMEDLDLRRD